MAVDLHNSSDSFFAQQPINQLDWSSPSLSHVSSATSSSSLHSPLDSELGSTESETERDHDADDYIVELTRQMANSMFRDFDDLNTIQPVENSIQGEADALEKQGNSKGVEESNTINGGFIDGPVSELLKKQALIDEQIRSLQLQRLKQEQTIRKQKQQQGKGRSNHSKNRALGIEPANINNKAQNPAWANPPQQQGRIRAAGRGGGPEVVRAVFLGDSGSSRAGATGTGVFLPRGIGNNATNPAEPRKKPGYSTVLMPARVVQALKLHFDKMGTAASTLDPPHVAAAAASNFPLPHDAVTGDVRYAFLLQQKSQSEAKESKNHPRNHRRHHHHQDMGLPQDWTY